MKTGDEVVGNLIDILNGLQIDYMVVGSFSSNRYGVPRATKDADFVLRVFSGNQDQLFDALPTAYQIDPQATFEIVTGTWRRIIEVPEVPFTIELFELSHDPFDTSRFGRRRMVTLLSRKAWLPTPEDVIVQKLRWSKIGRRTKDFDDAVSVLAVQGETAIDWVYVESWCSTHSTSDILAEAKAEAARVWAAEGD